MISDLIKMRGLLGTDTQMPALMISIHRKSPPVRLVKHTLGKERALRIAVLLVLEVRFVLPGPYKVSKSTKLLVSIVKKKKTSIIQ